MTLYLCDANVWLALAVAGHAHNRSALSWLDSVRDARSIVFCRSTQQAFLRLLTNRSVFAPYGLPAFTNEEAWARYDALIADDRIVFRASEPDGLWASWREYSSRPTSSTKVWMNAYLAAFAREGGYRFVTADGDFRQYAGLDLLLLSDD